VIATALDSYVDGLSLPGVVMPIIRLLDGLDIVRPHQGPDRLDDSSLQLLVNICNSRASRMHPFNDSPSDASIPCHPQVKKETAPTGIIRYKEQKKPPKESACSPRARRATKTNWVRRTIQQQYNSARTRIGHDSHEGLKKERFTSIVSTCYPRTRPTRPDRPKDQTSAPPRWPARRAN